MRVVLASRVTALKVKEALQRAVDLRNQQAARRDPTHLEKKLKAINDDQARPHIRGANQIREL